MAAPRWRYVEAASSPRPVSALVAPTAPQAPSLDERTQLPPPCSGWVLTAYPEVGECCVVFVPPATSDGSSSRWSDLSDEERRRRNLERASRRATTESRRYIVRNDLRRFWGFTFDDDHICVGVDGFLEAKRRFADFVDRVVRPLVGRDFPYWFAPEEQPKRSARMGAQVWSINFCVPTWVHLDKATLQRAWGQGNCAYSTHKADRGRRAAARDLAGYLSKYVAKLFDTLELPPGAQRYSVAEGFAPTSVQRSFATRAEAMSRVGEWFGGCAVACYWSSDAQPDWMGPPVHWWAFDPDT